MVRLKGHGQDPENINLTLFQFQYGAIKRFENNSEMNPSKLFQFQYGAIKRNDSTGDITKISQVSIPIWCD